MRLEKWKGGLWGVVFPFTTLLHSIVQEAEPESSSYQTLMPSGFLFSLVEDAGGRLDRRRRCWHPSMPLTLLEVVYGCDCLSTVTEPWILLMLYTTGF